LYTDKDAVDSGITVTVHHNDGLLKYFNSRSFIFGALRISAMGSWDDFLFVKMKEWEYAFAKADIP
jgi:hypothetical protein